MCYYILGKHQESGELHLFSVRKKENCFYVEKKCSCNGVSATDCVFEDVNILKECDMRFHCAQKGRSVCGICVATLYKTDSEYEEYEYEEYEYEEYEYEEYEDEEYEDEEYEDEEQNTPGFVCLSRKEEIHIFPVVQAENPCQFLFKESLCGINLDDVDYFEDSEVTDINRTIERLKDEGVEFVCKNCFDILNDLKNN